MNTKFFFFFGGGGGGRGDVYYGWKENQSDTSGSCVSCTLILPLIGHRAINSPEIQYM